MIYVAWVFIKTSDETENLMKEDFIICIWIKLFYFYAIKHPQPFAILPSISQWNASGSKHRILLV